jgi:restriction system protein
MLAPAPRPSATITALAAIAFRYPCRHFFRRSTPMGGPLLAALVFLALGGLATAFIVGVRLRGERERSGIMALAGMHWREFQRLVVAMLEQRGHRGKPYNDAHGDDGLLEIQHRDGANWLLSTKHGAGYVLGPPAIAEFASALRLHGAAGGWMTTLGSVSADNVALARVQSIELLDGKTLWSQIAPLLDAEQLAEITGPVRKESRRHLALAWGLAAAAAVAAFVLVPAGNPEPESETTATPTASASAAAAARPAQPNTTTAAPVQDEPPPDDPQALAARRRKLALAVGTLGWVDRAAWSTQSTLVVHLNPGATADKDALCALMDGYVELRASRLQLQPTRGSDQAVRFIQCRTY